MKPHLDSDESDAFERGTKQMFVLGKAEVPGDELESFDLRPVLRPECNAPRKPRLDTEDLNSYPAYLRVEDNGSGPDCLERPWR
ncbi:hypothetical protein [Streptomyces roseoverticillatus]|uniref:Uncharacterized protein n=1 Tax=Streptomyces roseoverticillatus TaxID=66429 RepID=A0ABV3J299_9ACTN